MLSHVGTSSDGLGQVPGCSSTAGATANVPHKTLCELQATLCIRCYATSARPVGRRVDVDDLVGATEIADRLELAQPQTVHLWRRRYDDFPEPLAQLRQGYLWSWVEVQAWAKRTGRRD